MVQNYRVGNCIVLNCDEVANKICYIPKRTLVVASSRDIEIEEYEEVVGHPDSSPYSVDRPVQNRLTTSLRSKSP